MEKRIKDICGFECIEHAETSLLKRINSILSKTPSQLNLADVCTLIRQETFLDIAIPKAVHFILSDPSVGDNYPFSLLKNLSEIHSYPDGFIPLLHEMVERLEASAEKIDFDEDDDSALFFDSIERIKKKIN